MSDGSFELLSHESIQHMYISNTTTENILGHLSRDYVNILLVGEHSEIDIEEIVQKCNDEGIVIAGGIFPMVIHNEAHLDAGIIIKSVKTTGRPHLIKDVSQPFFDELPDLLDETRTSIVLVDGLSSDISTFLETLYSKYWNQISYVGGGAGSLSLQRQKCIFTNEGFYENAGLVLLSEWETSLGVKHGWEKIAGPFVANKTDGNKILEINWRPAFEVYQEAVEKYTDQRFDSSDFFDIAKGFPFGIYREGQEDIVRDPISRDGNALVSIGKVERNTSLNILKGHNENLIESAGQAAAQASHPAIKDTFVVDCISRVLYLGDDFQEELKAVKSVLNRGDQALEGMLSLGEISSGVNGYLEFYNKTIVVSSFH